MFQQVQTRYYLSAFVLLLLILVFPVRLYAAYMDASLHSWFSSWPDSCFFLVTFSQLLLLITMTRKKKKPQFLFAMLASVVYGVMLLSMVMLLWFDKSYSFDNFGKLLEKPASLTIWFAVAIAGWILLLLGNKALIKELKQLDSQNHLR